MTHPTEFFAAGASLVVFAMAATSQLRTVQNNWFKLGIAVWGVGAAYSATDAFASLRDASSADLFIFVCHSLGAVGGALMGTSIEQGRWRLAGLRSPAVPREPAAAEPSANGVQAGA